MELSIIIVNYRSRDYLEGCLASIEKYLFASPLKNNFEVILVNNDKKDLAFDRSFSFPIKIINQKRNTGFGSANNIGAKIAKGDFLFFLNPDTELTGYGFFNMLEYAKSNDATGAIGPKIILAKENRSQPWTSGNKTTLWNVLFRNTFWKAWNKSAITSVDWVSGTALLLKKSHFEAIGGFDEKFFMYFEDQDFCLRLEKIGRKNIFYPFFQIIHFDGKSWNNTKEKKAKFYQSQDYFFRKHNPRWQAFLMGLLKKIFTRTKSFNLQPANTITGEKVKVNLLLSEKIFYALIFFLPFTFALNPSADFDLSVIRILIPLFFLIWLAESLKNKTLLVDFRPRFMFFSLFLFLVILSYSWAPDQTKALRKILFIFSFLPLYFVSFSLINQNRRFLKFLKTLFWSVFILAGAGLIQFFLQFILGLQILVNITRNFLNPFFLGENFAEAVSQYPSWLVAMGNFDLLRAFAIFPDPHLFSLFLNLSLPLILFLWLKTKNKFYLIGFFIVLSASLLSFSRASYLALAAAFIAGLFVFNFAQKIVKKPLFIGVSLLLIAGFFFFNNPLKERLFSSFDFNEGSVQGRLIMWQKAFEITFHNPYGGVGIGNFSTAINPSSDLRDPSYAHNLFLDFSSETGLLSAFFLLLLIVSPLCYYFRRSNSTLNKFLFLSFLILFVHCLFETPFYSVHVLPLILILLSINTSL